MELAHLEDVNFGFYLAVNKPITDKMQNIYCKLSGFIKKYRIHCKMD